MPDIVGLAAQDWGSSLCRALEDMWRQSVVCDTVIYANDGQTFNAHAAVLMASSPHLKTKLWAVKKQVFSVEIDSINSDTWTAVLNFMYTGKSTVERCQLEVIYEAAETLEIPELSQLCLQQLNNQPLAPGAKDLGSMTHDAQAQDLSSKDSDAPTDLSVKPANQEDAPAIPAAPPGAPVPNVAVWMNAQLSGQIRPMGIPQWPFPFPPNLMPNAPVPPFFGARPPHLTPPQQQAMRSNLLSSTSEEDEDKRHQCNVCGKRFRLRHVLQQHALTHTSLKPYFCDICGFRARQKAVIWKHKKLKHGKDSNKNSPVRQDMTLEEIQAVTGELGDNVSSSSGSPRETEKRSTPTSVQPPFDSESKESPESLKASSPPPATQRSTPVPDSPSSFGTNSKQFDCRTCGKTFRNKHVLAQHELIHSSFRPYACEYCNFRAKQKAVIWRHIKVKHPDMKEVSYRTETAPENADAITSESPAKDEDEMQKGKVSTFGRRVNNVIERLKTSISSKKSRSYNMYGTGSDDLPTMVPMNSPGPVTLTGYNFLRRYQCRICNKMFKNKHILMQHELVHSNLRPYKCEFCGFRAKQKAVMWRHHKSRHPEKGRVRIVEDMDLSLLHEASMEAAAAQKEQGKQDNPLTNGIDDTSGENNFEQGNNNVSNTEMDVSANCSIQDDDLDEELEDEKSDDEDEGDAYFCQICGKGFNDEESMEKHKLKHSDFKPHSCDSCDFRCYQEATLEKHKKIRHRVGKKGPSAPTETQDVAHVKAKDEKLLAPQLQRSSFSMSPSQQKNRLFYCNMCDFCTRHQTSLSRHKRLKHEGEMRAEDTQSQGSSIESGDLAIDESNLSSINSAFSNIPATDAQPGSPAVPPAQLMSFCLQQNPVAFPMFQSPGAPVMPIRMHMQQQQQQPTPPIMPNIGGDPEKRYTCGVCGRGFKHRHVLHQHSLVHTDLKPYACEFCDFRGRQKASLWRHRQKHLTEMNKGQVPTSYHFGIDGELQGLNAGKLQNMDEENAMFPGDGGEDENIDDAIPDDGLLMAEDYAENPGENFEDGELEEGMENDDMVEEEEEEEENGEDLEAFAENVEGGAKMEATVVSTADGQYACSGCGKILASKMSMQRHVHTHRTGKCYKCQECGYQTAYSFALQRHLRVHTGERPYSCDLCDKTFTQSGSLQWHKQHHHAQAVVQA